MNLSLSELFDHGGGAMWVLLAFSVIAVAVAIERAIVQWDLVARARALGSAVSRGLGQGALGEARTACERSPSPLADVFLVGFERRRGPAAHLGPAVHRERVRVGQALRRRLWILATIGATAPFVGLYGTVLGIRSAMQDIPPDETVKIGDVAAPISSALIVTAAGILVAVVAVILFNYFNQRVAAIAVEFRLLTDEFIEGVGGVADEEAPRRAAGEDAGDGDRRPS
ncbi:MAG: MotA/TolQ/ExbB proton channel family protein [Kofleriaceae bacterium]